MAESSIEISAAPAWLSRLESRREKLGKGKIGHESGAGSPCTVCGSKCPGLDLHFWRKVCRNCRCRKDQHDVPDDDLSGWAQFEILGAIRSKPAFLNVSALENKPVKLDWLPANVTPDLANDYLTQLGIQHIPISGSEAAMRRKQQLEYQVPPHDLDSTLCHNLSNTEQQQHQEHVAKIKEACVGQGYVTRIGTNVGILANVGVSKSEIVRGQKHPASGDFNQSTNRTGIDSIYDKLNKPVLSSIEKDKILSTILESDSVKGIRFNPESILPGSVLHICDSVGNKIPVMEPDFIASPYLSTIVQNKLISMKINSAAIQSAVLHGWAYDNIFKDLDNTGISYEKDSYLAPLKKFRKEYLENDDFKNETNLFSVALGGNILSPIIEEMFNAADKAHVGSTTKGSPNHNTGIQPIEHNDVYGYSTITSENTNPKGPNYSDSGAALPPINYDTFPGQYQPIQVSENKREQPQYMHVGVNENIQTPLEYQLRFTNNPDYYISSILDCFKNPQHSSFIPKHVGHNVHMAKQGKFIKDIDRENEPLAVNIKSSIVENKLPLDNIEQGVADMYMSSTGKDNLAINCQECSKDIRPGEVAVQADRAGKNVAWHPQCFVCHKCHELLADLVYFYHKEHVYCARDLADLLKIPRCRACDELIFTREYTLAENDTFHLKHFCCFECDAPLAGKQYIPDDITNQPLCLGCYEIFHADRCHSCKIAIGASEQGVAWATLHWHTACFVCAGKSCGKSLLGGRFVVKNELPFCSAVCVRSVAI